MALSKKAWGWIVGSAVVVGFFVISDMLSPKPVVRNYASETICNDAFEKNQDHTTDNSNHFDVTLREGCFDAVVTLPKAWHNYFWQPIGNQNGDWIAFWFVGRNPVGPFGPNDAAKVDGYGSHFRLQGKGSFRFYSNDVLTSAKEPTTTSKDTAGKETTSSQPEEKLGSLQVRRREDPHACAKPDDAHYEGWHAAALPKFLFDVHNNDFSGSSTPINWGQGFKGAVPVCFLVDEKGNPTNIQLLHGVENAELQKHIVDVVAGWRYNAGMWEDQPVKTQMLVTFFFD